MNEHPTWFIADTQQTPSSWFAWRAAIEVVNFGPVLVRIAVDSKYWLSVNGILVIREGGLKRGPAPHQTYADVIDLTAALHPGRNVLAIHHWFFGRDGFSHANSGRPGFFFEVVSGNATIVSPWRVLRDAAFFDAGFVRPGSVLGYRLAENSIGYDARISLGNWTQNNFDDSAWPFATQAECDAWGPLVDRPIPQFAWSELTTVAAPSGECDLTGYTVYRVPLPYNAQFVPFLKIKARPGLKIQILSDSSEHCLTAEYITCDGEQSWESPGWMNGHQIIFRIPDSAVVHELGYRETSYACRTTGSFVSNDEASNELWQRSLRTLRVTMRDTFMDCPDRERAQWWGDEVIQLAQTFYSLDAQAYALIRKGILEFAAWQREDDVLYSPIPSGNCFRELPLQSLASVGRYGLGEYWLQTGDLDTIRKVFPAVKRYLALWHLDDNGIPIVREGGWKWGDWGTNCDHEALTACWLWLALTSACRIACELGEGDYAQEITHKIELLFVAFQKHFRAEGGIRGPSHTGPLDDRANALAVLCGFYVADDRPALAEILFRQRYASPYMEKYVLEALFVLGRADLALTRMRERYRGMLAMPLTTLLELFPENGLKNNTTNHSWSGAPLLVLGRWVSGLEPLQPGWKVMRCRPQPGDLTQFSLRFESPAGPIAMDYSSAANRFTLELTVPGHVQLEWDFSLMATRLLGAISPDVKSLPDLSLLARHPGGHWSFVGELAPAFPPVLSPF